MPRVEITVEAESGTRITDQAVRDEATMLGRKHADERWTKEQASRAILVAEYSEYRTDAGCTDHHFRYEAAE